MEIPGYRDLVEIGRGRASTVYRAEQHQPGRTVAIKVLSVGVVEDRLRRRFERECAATDRLSGHPNIVTVLDSGFTADGNPFITTAYYANGSLGDRLAAHGPLPVDEVLRVGVKIAGALEAVHAVDVLHRDIKPSNLLATSDGEPALTGFGISAMDPTQQAMTMAQSFAPVHTPPEVILGRPATAATDTYQLASTLYALLAGHAPFETGTDDGLFAMLSRIQEAPVPAIDRPDVPDIVVEALRIGLAKEPEHRDASSLTFGERLRQVQLALGLAPTDLVTSVAPAFVADAPAHAAPVSPPALVAPEPPLAPVEAPTPAPPPPPTAPSPAPPPAPGYAPPPEAGYAAPPPDPAPVYAAPPAYATPPPTPAWAPPPTPTPMPHTGRDEDRNGLKRLVLIVVVVLVLVAMLVVYLLLR